MQLADLTVAGACCQAAPAMIDHAIRERYGPVEAEKITLPVQIVWGTADKLLPGPSSAVRFRNDWLPDADWVELDGVGHSQLDLPLEAAQLVVGFAAGGPRRSGLAPRP